MIAWPAPIAYEATAAPSMSRCGLAIISGTSLQAPGSDSSALTTRKCGLLSPFGRKLHFMPVPKPAPPRPRSPASRTTAMTSSRDMPSAFGSACQPPARRYPSMVKMSGWSQCAVTGFPARRSSASWRAEAGVILSKNSQFTIITGAYTQAALHSRCSRLTRPSGVVRSDRAARVQDVEDDHPGDLGLGQPEFRSAEHNAVDRDIALLRLDEMEQRKQRRPRPRILADDLVRVGVQTRQ